MKKNKNILIVFLFFFLSISLFSLCFFDLDSDYLWHITAGKYMFSHGLLKKDVFSWFVYSKYWMSHEWLFEVILYLLKKVFGSFHIFIYCFGCIFTLSILLFLSNWKFYLKNVLFTFIWAFFFLLILFNVQARPHLGSYCFLGITMYLLMDNYRNSDSKKIFFLPILSIVWSNFHGGSSNIPYLLCFLFLIGNLFSFSFSKIEGKKITKEQLIRYVVVMFLCMIAVCINLHGIRMFFYPYENMLNSTMISNITEWRSTTLNEPIHYFYFLFLIFILFTFLFSKKKILFIDFLLFGFCAYLGLKSIRFWFYTYIVMSYIIFSYVPSRKMDSGTKQGIICLSILLITLFFIRKDVIFPKKYYKFLDDKDIRVLKKEGPVRLFNMYDYGGDLIYHHIPVFIDGRADLYSNYNYDDYLKISQFHKDTVSLIEKYQFDYFLVDSNYPIANYLSISNYDLIYSRDNVLLYKKREN